MPSGRFGAVGLLLFLPSVCFAQSSAAIAYLNRALDEMQARAWRRGAVDWPRLRAEALGRAAFAQTPADTYDAIRFALASLGDHHSSFHPKTPNASGDQSTGPAPDSPFSGRYEPEGRMVAFGKKDFAMVTVTKCFPENDRQFVEYETKLQGVVAYLDRLHPAGWLVDLRGNVGGNMWPMLAGIGPVLGEGDHLGEFFTTDGHSVWQYRDGAAAEVPDNGKADRYPPVAGTPHKLAGTPTVAVLVDGGTGSSGEAIAIAFKGRPKTRFFGAHTQGASTANDVVGLSDGASMWLTIGVDADRTGKQYLNGFDPDEAIQGSGKIVPDGEDAVVQGALRWLSGGPPR
jgi:carboxyl-terminal processing protease